MIIEEVKNINIGDFDYPLPDERIARHPLAVRDACRLIVPGLDGIRHAHFNELPELLPRNSILVCNDTRVINARMRFQKASGANIEIFLLEPVDPQDYVLMFQSQGHCRWSCLVGNAKRWKEGPLSKNVVVEGREVTLTAERVGEAPGNARIIDFSWTPADVTFASIVDAAGFIPIPPYLRRESEQSDASDYQTCYAEVRGSVAAPTAGLHFTPALMEEIERKGVDVRHVTLHVGAGTFQPVKSDIIGEHPMHTEVFTVDKSLLLRLEEALTNNIPVTAVGTTSVRTLESIPILGMHVERDGEASPVTQWEAYEGVDNLSDEEARLQTLRWIHALVGWMEKNGMDSLTAETSIMIAPGFRWRIVDSMVTNFHQPKSTLLLLVSSFLGNNPDGSPKWRGIYDEALRGDYRFLSYGDACFFRR